MSHRITTLAFSTFLMASCHVHKAATQTTPVTAEVDKNKDAMNLPLSGKMQIKKVIKIGDPVMLTLTVYNDANDARRFCKWHTPFEPLMSKYLEIKNEAGEEIDYQGPMAKRMMPPPADSYIKINPKDSIAASVDLIKAYAIKLPGKYTITYVGGNMSGVTANERVSFVYGK